MIKKIISLLVFTFVAIFNLSAQVNLGDNTPIEYISPKEYEIGGITISGTKYLDEGVLINLSGLSVGQKLLVPGEQLSKAIESLWKQGLFSDVKIVAQKIQNNTIFLTFKLTERPRLSRFSFKGVSKSDADKIREKIKLVQGKVVTENVIQTTTNITKAYYSDKGFLNAKVDITQKKDSALQNSVLLVIAVDKKKKVKIDHINISGNTAFTEVKIKRTLKDTKEKHWYRIFSSSKYLEENFEKDKQKLIAKYNAKGYRDAKIEKDSVYKSGENTLSINLKLSEGRKFYFRNISWVGNSVYSSQELSSILSIKKGDVFDQSSLDTRLFSNPNGKDVSSLYLDNGYLFFHIEPVEVKVENDSIDLELRIQEGKQARINKVTVSGNTKTNDRVIMREIKTRPGQLFSKSDIVRSQRDLSQLGYFNPEKMNVIPKPNPSEGTVDINYIVEEKPSDQVELSGGYGAGRVVGTLGLTFSNFSARNVFKGSSWKPLPSGDGQRLSLRFQTNGLYYQSYNASFVEPWLGGKKPTSLSASVFYSALTNGLSRSDANLQATYITGTSLGLGKRLTFPDDYFTIYHELSFQKYLVVNSTQSFLFSNGHSNNFSFSETLARNSTDQPIYPRSGSQFSFTIGLTPPYSLINGKDYTNATQQERYRWIEYHKYKFSASWFTRVAGNLVLNSRAKFGFLGNYSSAIGQSPFERFYLGGSGLTGFRLDGREIIALRGYEDNTVTPYINGSPVGATAYNKFTFELRYPVSLNPSATVYGLVFAEGGNSWLNISQFDPFSIKRSAGVGIRVFLPMLGGLLGLDYGWGFDPLPNNAQVPGQGHLAFSIGASME